ncbi:hypothetical protein ACH436_13235 [Isoptericola sp. NPDC019693]|uniref:hypothetical protein n=1 Tax=Isoptericola sp. NPDC019693 TaxID=3364009 RepID=UPI0037ABD24E
MHRRLVVSPSLRQVAAAQEGLVSSGQCREHGLTKQNVAALVGRQEWGRVARGVFDTGVGGGTADLYDLPRRRAALVGVLARPGSVATGLCALVWQGVQGAPARIAPEVTFPDGSPRSGGPGRVRRERLRRWVVVGGLPCVPAELALAQAVPELDREHAVAMMDSARHQRIVTEDEFHRAREATRGRRGAARTSPWWGESDRRAESPIETAARLACTDATYPPDALQLVVRRADGRFLGRSDLAWLLPGGRVLLVELDGRDAHTTPTALFGDRSRQNGLTSHGAVLLRFTGRDVARGVVVDEVRRVLAAAGWSPHPWPADRAFVLLT